MITQHFHLRVQTQFPILAAMISLAAASSASAGDYVVEAVGPIGTGVGWGIAGADINNQGKAVGVASSSFFDDLAFQPWLWEAGDAPLDLVPGGPPNQFLQATAINDAGLILGNILDAPNGVAGGAGGAWGALDEPLKTGLPFPIFSVPTSGFWASDGSGQFTPIPGLGEQLGLPEHGTYSRSVNAAGQVVGVSYDGGNPMFPDQRAFLFDQRGRLQDLSGAAGPGNRAINATAINDAGLIVGIAQVPAGNPSLRVFIRDPRKGTTLLPTFSAPNPQVTESVFPAAVNSSGVVVGSAEITTVIGKDDVGFPIVTITGVNFRWDAVNGIMNLGSFSPMSINDSGVISGFIPAMTSFGPGAHAALWENGVVTDLHEFVPPNSCNYSSTARNINNAGQVLLVEQRCFKALLNDFLSYVLTPNPGPLGDLNSDDIVNGVDLGILLANWSIPAQMAGCAGANPCLADIDHNGVVNGVDLGILLSNWTM